MPDVLLTNIRTGNNISTSFGMLANKEAKVDVEHEEEVKPLQKSDSSRIKLKLWCRNEFFSVKLLKRRLPILGWLPIYSFADFKGDLIAGTTVALTVIPQGLALALLAGLAPQFGLYTAFMGCFVYTIFGSCKDLTIGPTSIMSLMTAHHVATGGITYCILLTFLAGCIMLLMGILNLGFLVTFISSSVVSGFTTAAAITIATSQLAGLLGLKFKSEGFLEDIIHAFEGIINGEVKYLDMAMGICCILFLLLLNYFKGIKFSCLPDQTAKGLSTLWRLIVTARNAILVLISAGIAAVLLTHNVTSLTLTQEVDARLPPFQPPKFSYSYFDNATNQTVHRDFIQIARDMGSGIVVIPLLCVLEAVAIAKSFAKGKKIDATQEMIALGICNIMGSFVSSYPATGSFSRTAINYNSGVRTPAGGIATGSLVLIALAVMSPYFRFIPKASLSALIFVAVLNMVHYKDIAFMWRTNKLDLIPFFATIIFSFILGLEYGILIGVGISVCFLLLQEARPKIVIEERKTFLGNIYLYVQPDRSVFFPSAEYLQSKVIKSVPDVFEDNAYAIVIDGRHITNADYTMAMSCKNLVESYKHGNVCIIFTNLKNNVLSIIKGAIPESKFFHSVRLHEAESFIDGFYIDKDPPAYDSEVNMEPGASADGLDSGLYER